MAGTKAKRKPLKVAVKKRPSKDGPKPKSKPKTRVRSKYDAGNRRWYTDDERANFLAAVHACGGNCLEASRKTGVPVRTLDAWARGYRCPEALQLCQDKKGKLADAAEELAWLFAAVAPERIDEASLKDLVQSFGTMVNMMRLLRDQSTANSYNRNVNANLNADLSLSQFAENYKRLATDEREHFNRLLAAVSGNSTGDAGAPAVRSIGPGGTAEQVPSVFT